MTAVHFIPQAEIRQAADSAAAEHSRRILERLPGAEINHVGATAVPGALTKGDVDLAVRVDRPEFLTSCVELGCLCLVHQPDYNDAKERFWEPALARLREPGAHS
ncbi:MAG TPA: GrpB family protein [Thermoleophilaceae bacterium]|nr:GrpB family protein [Thermoleophilaceae bacterium]